MKIKVTKLPYEQVIQKKWPYVRPRKQSYFLRRLAGILAKKELRDVGFICDRSALDAIGREEPCLILMNHSSFTDLMIIAELLKHREYHIVCTNDGFIGKAGIMRAIGGIPTRKFITDLTLVKDMRYVFDHLKSAVVMYPEASYSFDGTQTPLPESLGKCIRMMGVPVIMIRTSGAFLRDPLYNNLQKRKARVSAVTRLVVSKEECKTLPAQEINARLAEEFRYDHFREQKAAGVLVDEPFRADGLERVLYKCPNCMREGTLKGSGVYIRCGSCQEEHMLETDGTLRNTDESRGTRFAFVSDWYAWLRKNCFAVRK